MKTRKLILLTTFFLLTVSVYSSQTRKVLIMGLDGVRWDALQQANTPNIDALIAEGFFTYDAWHLGITVSGPSWSTIMTGVWWNKHGVYSNAYTGSKFNQYPYFTTRAKEIIPSLRCVQVIEWPPLIDDVYNDSWDLELKTPDGDGAATAAVAVQQLQDTDLDVMFVYFDQVDLTGHSSGFDPNNPSYMQAIENLDGHVGNVVNAVKNRTNYANENWLILVITDHGGRGTGHGGISFEERHIWWIASGNSVLHQQIFAPDPGTYNLLGTGIFNQSGVDDNLLKQSPVQADIAVTALHHLLVGTGIDPEGQPAWDLDGKSWLNTFLDTSTGIASRQVENESITVYPNPTSGLVTLWFQNPTLQKINYSVSDLAGKIILRNENVAVLNKLNINLANHPRGNYIITLEIGAQRITKRVSLQP